MKYRVARIEVFYERKKREAWNKSFVDGIN